MLLIWASFINAECKIKYPTNEFPGVKAQYYSMRIDFEWIYGSFETLKFESLVVSNM